MPTQTTNYGLSKPLVNNPIDQDLWGGELNADMDELDSLILTSMNFIPVTKTATFSVSAPTPGSSVTGNSKTLFRCDATASAIAPDLPTAVLAGPGYTVAFKKIDSSTNSVTITASGSDKIDGSSTFALAVQYNWAILVSDGVSNWDILSDTPVAPPAGFIKAVRVQTFINSGTYTPDAHLSYCQIEACGSGAGGAGTNSSNNQGGGGGAGSYARLLASAATIGVSQAITIGANGTAGSASGGNGGNGNTTSLGTLCVAGGGFGGVFGTNIQPGGNGGTASAGDLQVGGGDGFISAFSGSNSFGGNGGASFFGGGGKGGNLSTGGVTGNPGIAYGSGGGGAGGGNNAGGAGAQGIVIITEYCTE